MSSELVQALVGALSADAHGAPLGVWILVGLIPAFVAIFRRNRK